MNQISNVFDVYRGGWQNVDDFRPSSGDIIDFNRTTYTHHGIYVGNGNVVHKVAKYESPTIATILLQSLRSVADGDDVRINNHETGAWTRGLSARSPWGIVARAMAEVGKEEDYSVYELNCEEFATRMRYGEGWSSQAGLAESAGALGIPASGAASLGSHASQSLPQGPC